MGTPVNAEKDEAIRAHSRRTWRATVAGLTAGLLVFILFFLATAFVQLTLQPAMLGGMNGPAPSPDSPLFWFIGFLVALTVSFYVGVPLALVVSVVVWFLVYWIFRK
ncbi:MAG: hypothetical protein WHV44_12570 [Anaerolineales bacterium]